MALARAADELTQRLGRSPTLADLAAHLDLSEDEVVETLCSARAYQPLSLHAPVDPATPDTDLADLVGDVDPGLEAVTDHEALRPLLAALPRREQRILAMRFYGSMTQAQIAAELGVSQMHVSRLLAQTLATLRAQLLDSPQLLD